MTIQPDQCVDYASRIARLERRIAREKAARAAAEETAERGLRLLYERQMDAVLLGQVASYANNARDVDEAFGLALEGILERTGWSFGAVYMVAPDGYSLLPSRTTRSSDETTASLSLLSEQAGFGPGEDVVGLALTTKEPATAEKLTGSPMNLSRRLVAAKCDIRSAVAVPVLSGTRVVAVMEFMSGIEGSFREGLLDLLKQVAAQTARVFEREEMARRLQHDALHDPLTGLPNRQLFADRLDRAVLAYHRNGLGYAVLFIDLDRFKAVNDGLGHAAGDAVLLAVAGILNGAVNAARATAQATVARMGGDEFCILVEDGSARDLAEALAQRILDAVGTPLDIRGHKVPIGASIGLAHGGEKHGTGDEIIRDADAAMYQAKLSGRSRVQVYTDAFRQKHLRRETLESQMRQAVDANFDGFSLVYQPIVALGTGSLEGFEALARWQSASGERIPPSEFIPIAEESGLIGVLGDWILDTALCRLAAVQRERRHRAAPLSMSINVSSKQLRPDFAEAFSAALAKHGVEAGAIHAELTESVALGDDSSTAAVLRQLRELGVRLSIDDFGTGYSTFGYLQKFPFDTLKIDRSFIGAMSDGQNGLDIVKAIVEMARGLGVSIIAEGTEKEEHVEMLRSMGCDHAQGYFFSQPLTDAELDLMLAYDEGWRSKVA